MAPIGYSGARGKRNLEQNLTSKISCQTPFNVCCTSLVNDGDCKTRLCIFHEQKQPQQKGNI
jgi:hypothetical protein